MKFIFNHFQKINIRSKIYILLSLAIIPLFSLIIFTTSILQKDILFRSKEVNGIENIRILHSILTQVQLHRGMTNIYLSGQDVLQDLAYIQNEIEHLFLDIKRKNEEDNNIFRIKDHLGHFEEKWKDILAGYTFYNQQQSFKYHTGLIQEIIFLVKEIADKSNLTLDPNLDSYNLIKIIVNIIPEMQDILGELRGKIAMTNTKKRRKTILNEILNQKIRINYYVQKLVENLSVVFAENKEAEKTLYKNLDEFILAKQDYFLKIDREIIAKENLEVKPLDIFGHGTEVIDKLVSLHRITSDNLESILWEYINSLQRNKFIFWAVILVFCVLIFILSFYTIRSISRPMKNVMERVIDISEGEGDLTHEIDNDSPDELGQLSQALNLFIIKTRHIVKDVIQSSMQLKQVIEVIVKSTDNFSSSTEKVNTQTQEITNSVKRMNDQLQNVLNAVEKISASTDEVSEKTIEAAKVTSNASKIAHNTNDLVNDFVEKIGEIDHVIKTISDIAEQTKLLALNASIEAARAGEEGQGFGVVASEIKELSRQTSNSSEEIKLKIKDIQKSTDEAILTIRNILKIIINISDITSSIAHDVEEQARTVKEMARTIKQTYQKSNDVANNVVLIGDVMKNLDHDSINTANRSIELQNISKMLNNLVSKFKVS